MWRGVTTATAAIALALVTLQVVRTAPGFSLTQGSTAGQVLLLSTVAALAVASMVTRRAGLALLLALVGVAWLAPDWNNPAAPATLFALGLVIYAGLPAVVAHLAVDSLGRGWWWLVGAGYAVCVGPRLLAALFLDPATGGCQDCVDNLLLVRADARAWSAAERWGLWSEALWLLVTLALLTWWTAHRRRAVASTCIVSLTLSLVGVAHSLATGLLLNDPTTHWLWRGQAVVLMVMAGVVIVDAAAVRRGRRSLTRVVGGLAAPEQLRSDLARVLGDPHLVLASPVEGGLADGVGSRVDPTADGRVATRILSGRHHLATIGHRPDLDPRRAADYAESVALGLEHVRLRAVGLAQLDAIRRAGVTVLAAGDAERRRLERDLHDGAQQSVVMLLLRLGLAPSGPGTPATRAHLQEAVDRLRVIAHGLHPSTLDHAGLAASLEALRETRQLQIGSLPAQRYDRAVEATAYLLVERCAAAGPIAVSMRTAGGDLLVEVDTGSAAPPDLTDVADRVTTLDGSLDVGDHFVRTTLPVGSRRP